MVLEVSDQIDKFREYIELTSIDLLHSIVSRGHKALIVDFKELAQFDHELSEYVLNEPDDATRAAEMALDQFDFVQNKIRVRFRNLAESEKVYIKDIRSLHLGKLIMFDGLVRQASDVRPQVITPKFERPSCGTSISILQVETRFKEPIRCSCGRRGKFRLLSKDLVDAQRLVIEEVPESLVGGEQPKRISVLLREDLVEPIMEKKTTPGSSVRITGVLKEVPVFLRTGAQSIRFDLMIESSFLEPVE